MAHVSPAQRGPTDGGSTRNEGRGQLILVSAVSLAVLFVTLALILNTAIYTENLASRSGDHGGATDAVRYHDAARGAVEGTLDYVNANNQTSQTALQSNLTAAVDAFRNHSSRLFAGGDRAVETNLDSSIDGTRIEQNDSSRNFTDTSGDGNWTVVSRVNYSRAFTMNVTRSALVGTDDLPFTLVVDNGTSSWRMNLTTAGSDVVVRTTRTTCRVNAEAAWVNVTAGTVAGEECEGFTFADGVTGPYEIRYENASNIEGTYRVIVDNGSLADTPSPHLLKDGEGQPFAAHAIYSANLTVDYETSRLSYNSTIRVAPGEADD